MKWFGLELTQAYFVQFGVYFVVFLLIANFFQPISIKAKSERTWRRFQKADPLIRAGTWATVGFLLVVLILFGFETCVDDWCGTKFEHLFSGASNEVGDTLAGLAGSLAFLWIIITVLLQSKELREQRLELFETRREFQKQNDIHERNLNILETSERRQSQKDADDTLKMMLVRFNYFVDWYRKRRAYVKWLFEDCESEASLDNPSLYSSELFYALREKVSAGENGDRKYNGPYFPVDWKYIVELSNAAIELEPELSAAGRHVLKQSLLRPFSEMLERIDEDPGLVVHPNKLEAR